MLFERGEVNRCGVDTELVEGSDNAGDVLVVKPSDD